MTAVPAVFIADTVVLGRNTNQTYKVKWLGLNILWKKISVAAGSVAVTGLHRAPECLRYIYLIISRRPT